LQKQRFKSKEQFQAAIAAGRHFTNNAKGEMEGEQLGWVSPQDKLMKNTKVTVGQMQYTLTILNPPLKHGMRQ
jgi:hypothetical protein